MTSSKRFSQVAAERRKLWFERFRRRPTHILGPDEEALFALIHRSARPVQPSPVAAHRVTPELAWRVAYDRIAVRVTLRGKPLALLRPLFGVRDCDDPKPQELLRFSDRDFRRRRNELLNAIGQGEASRGLLQFYDLLLARLGPLPPPASADRLASPQRPRSAHEEQPLSLSAEESEPVEEPLEEDPLPTPPLTLTSEQARRVEQHTDLVRRLARRVFHLMGRPVLSRRELASAGYEGLVAAARRYDPRSPASFNTYAHYRVYGAMMDAIRSEGRARGRHEPEWEYFPASLELNPEQALIAADQRSRLWSLVEQLEPPERQLVEALYVEEDTMKAYARELGVHTSTVSRRHGKILTRLGKRWLAQERAKLVGSLHPERQIAVRTRNALSRRLPSRES